MKKKLNLSNLKVSSFVTSKQKNQIIGGVLPISNFVKGCVISGPPCEMTAPIQCETDFLCESKVAFC